MRFYDFEREIEISIEELEAEFKELREARETEAICFEDYLENCMDYNNGTLEVIR